MDYKCPFAREENYTQHCKKQNDFCAHQKYCRSKGRWVLTEQAQSCPLREEKLPEKPVKKRGKKNG